MAFRFFFGEKAKKPSPKKAPKEETMEEMMKRLEIEEAALAKEQAKIMAEFKHLSAHAAKANAAIMSLRPRNRISSANINAELAALGNLSNNEGVGRGAGASAKPKRSSTSKSKGAAGTRAATNAELLAELNALVAEANAAKGKSKTGKTRSMSAELRELEDILGARLRRGGRRRKTHRRRHTRRHR